VKRMLPVLLFTYVAVVSLVSAQTPRTPSVEGAKTYFQNLQDGAVINLSCPLKVEFGLDGMGIAPAGVEFPHTGHLHLLIDVDETKLDMNVPLPFTDNISHFGLGQTETCLELATGEHTLQILLADHNHIPHDPPVLSEKISIIVR
jgi:Domain of unknown function (DUF4399)